MNENNQTILFVGDPHGDFRSLRQSVVECSPAAVVTLGDHDLDRPLDQAIGDFPDGVDFAWIPGNHDSDLPAYYDNLFDSALAGASLHARVRTVAGVRIAGLGGVFRQRVWHPDSRVIYPTPESYLSARRLERWRDGLPLRHRTSIFWADYERLWDESADLLVTHEAPSCHRYGYAAIDELAKALGARIIVHGHHHETYRTTLADGIVVQGVGLAGVVDLDGNVLVPGKTDAVGEG